MVSAMPYRSAENPVSLETPVGDREETYLKELVADQKTLDPSLAATNTQRGSMIDRALNSLTERNKKSFGCVLD